MMPEVYHREQQSCRSKQGVQTSAHVSIVAIHFSILIRPAFYIKETPKQMDNF